MDKVETKQQYLCPEHPEFQLEYLQVESLNSNRKDQKLFYCSDCAYQDKNFKHSNYLLIKHIIKAGTDQILQNWPPVNDNQLLNQLIKASKGKDTKPSIVLEIEQFFKDLTTDILKLIEASKKKIIQQALNCLQNKVLIQNKYQALSKIQELKSLLENNRTDIYEKERQYRVLLENIQSEKKTITEQIELLLQQYQKQENIFNFKSALKTKESILKSVRSIDLINQRQLDVQLMATDFQNGKDYQTISKNESNEYQLIIHKDYDFILNTVSNIILQNDAKYIFRLEIQMLKEDINCYIGFMQNKNINTKQGTQDYLNCNLKYINNCIQLGNNNYGISKQVKGNAFALSKENEIEIRICIEDQILELYDYPNYQCKLVLDDKYKSNLINHSDLRLYLGLRHLNDKIILKEAFTVTKFN